ncbi:Ribonuclease H2 non-catalytic subunit (Ylr154p-like) [Popillia japonica]|uniref:Ribonuclease H2 non-catalytic subunit (Ylr154p-like) n=1 Tax=Popillia japonica TaxID=7064 RepID=A0AAW1KHJ5_POPJA
MATIHIQSGKNSVNYQTKSVKIQSMPCKIHADCDAKVSQYFNTYVKGKKDTDGVLTASFRGYPLEGKEIQVPKGYKGVILHESVRPDNDTDDRKFYCVNTFDSFTYWNWNKTPTGNDKMIKALDWIDIAEALHAPIEEE